MAEAKGKPKPRAKAKPLVAEKIIVYRDQNGEWRWNTVAANNKIVSESSEGYRNRNYTLRMAREMNPGLPSEWGPR